MGSLRATANLLVAVLSENTSLVINSTRRGYSAVASAVPVKKVVVKEEKKSSADVDSSSSSSAWVPDPVTGCYMPANRAGEVDPVELRKIFLSKERSSLNDTMERHHAEVDIDY